MTWQLQSGDNEGLASVWGVILLVLLLSMLAITRDYMWQKEAELPA